MNGVTTRCVSFAQGNKDPLQRINYAFGLVLGVDEFVDEQCYFLEKEYMHNRALHGCGTVSGLHVSAAANNEDIEIRVAPGMGIDQYGRLFVVSNEQCASLLTWLADQEVTGQDQTLYVVARYAECETELVPIAGQPCSSSEQLSAPSRIRDTFEISFALRPPPHQRHNAVVNLGEFLSRFRRDTEAESLGDLGTAARLEAIIGPDVVNQTSADFQTHLNMIIADLTNNAGAQLIPVLPGEAETLVNAIFAYWITRVRPQLLPDLINPATPENAEAEPPVPDILLAQIDVAGAGQEALELGDITIDNTLRPYLLHTQLIQELFDIQDRAGAGNAETPDEPVFEFARLDTLGVRRLSLWVHLDQNLALQPGENISMFRIGADGSENEIQINLNEDVARRGDAGRYYDLRTQTNLNPGDRLLLLLAGDRIQTSEAGENQQLSELIRNLPFTFNNFDPTNGRLTVFHVVEQAPSIDPGQIQETVRELIPPPTPIIPFVTITPITVSDGEVDFLQDYELWFHLDIASQNEGGIADLNRENLLLFTETGPGNLQQIQIDPSLVVPNVWMANPSFTSDGGTTTFRIFATFARFVFPLDAEMRIRAFNPNAGGLEDFATLREYMERTGQRLDGHLTQLQASGGDALVIYVREQGRARGVLR